MSTKTEDGPSLVITQPMLMPWHGIFSQMSIASRILIYDDVQLPYGRSFITRVQIKTPKGTEWLSVPVQRSGQGKQRICDSLVGATDWRCRHLARIEQAYRRAPHFRTVFNDVVKPVYENQSPRLVDFLVGSMARIAEVLGMPSSFELTSSGGFAEDFSGAARIVEICRRTGTYGYLSGNGGMSYLDYDPFEEIGVRVYYMDYRLRPYPQLHGEFTPYVSLIDLLFCIGVETAHEYLETVPIYWKDWPYQIDGRPVPSEA